jgi:GDP-L-fucose synthase
MKLKDKIFVAGHKGLFGSAILRTLKKKGFKNILFVDKKNVNLENQKQVDNFFKKNKPKHVFLAAAKAGGILANMKKPAEFIYKNLLMQNNIIHAAYKSKVEKLLFLGSSCIYPKHFLNDIKETDLLSGHLEETNKHYAIAKIAGIYLCDSYNRQYFNEQKKFRAIIPTNLFGPNDNYHPLYSHVIAALIARFKQSVRLKKKEIRVWGTGRPKREFMFSDDAAEAAVEVLRLTNKKFEKLVGKNLNYINIGTGKDYSINQICLYLKKISGYKGKIIFDKKYPDGMYRKLMSTKLTKKIPFKIKNNFFDSLKKTYLEY